MSQGSKLVELHKKELNSSNGQSVHYVASGAITCCSQGTSDVQMIFPNRGYFAGYREVGLDVDTSTTNNFSGTFGCCRCTGEQCHPSFVDQWVETETRQTFNGGHPLLVKSMLVCKKGGVISFKNNGQSAEDTMDFFATDCDGRTK